VKLVKLVKLVKGVKIVKLVKGVKIVKKHWDNKNDLSFLLFFYNEKVVIIWHGFLPNFLGTI
jgi:hypothetical protein